MPLKKTLFFLSCILPLFSMTSAAGPDPSQGTFTSISGEVTVDHGKKTRQAVKGSPVKEGDKITAAKDSTATLRFFDGSELKVKSATQFTISRLEKKEGEDKILKFKLAAGSLWAGVKKLISSKSSFEIEAGGVVCGVRGTEYEVHYDPGQDKVDVFVFSGNVWAETGGETFQYGPGHQGHFHDGKPGADNGASGHGPHGQGNKDQGGHDPQGQGSHSGDHFENFYGMNGDHHDPFQPLTGTLDDPHGIAGQTGDDGLLGPGAHKVIIQLKYPELP